MNSNKIYNFFQDSMNFNQKILSIPKKLRLFSKLHEDKIVIISLCVFLLLIGIISIYNALSLDFLFFKIVWSLLFLIALYFLFPFTGSLIVTFNPYYPFDLKIYTPKLVNNKIVTEELPLPILIKLRNREKNNYSNENQHNNNNLLVPLSSNKIEYKTTNFINYKNTYSTSNDEQLKYEFGNSKNLIPEEITLKQIINNEKDAISVNTINYENRPKFKTGPGGIGHIYFALKYIIIQRFYQEEGTGSQKYKYKKDFYETVSVNENIPFGGFKTQHSRLSQAYFTPRKLELNYKKVIILLYDNNEFKIFPLAEEYAKSLKIKETD